MFGYIRPAADELKVKEYNTYRAIYCGLCRSLGRCSGCLARFTLSYDFVFLALVRAALTGEKMSFDKGRCPAHPFKKRPYALPGPSLDFCACTSSQLVYYKLLDDINDCKGLKRLTHIAARPFAAHSAGKAAAGGVPDALISDRLRELDGLERSRTPSADAPAEVFGRLLADIAGHGLTCDGERIAREICLHTGKWIYFADAVDDCADDARSGSYNPIVISYPDDMTAGCENILGAMAYERSRALGALELASCDTGAKAILTNILTCGMMASEKKLSEKNNGQPV